MAVQQINHLIKFTNSQGENTTGTLIKVSRNSIVMEVYNPYSIVQLSEILSDLCVRRDKRVIYQGKAVVTSLVNTGLMLIVSVTLIDPWQDLAELLQQGIKINEEVNQFVKDWEATRYLRLDYQLAVEKLRSFLVELSRWLEQVDMIYEDGLSGSRIQDNSFEELKTALMPHLTNLYIQFEEEAAKVSNDELVTHKIFTQRSLHPLMLQAPFVDRTFNKPLGYAGDYEMMNMIQREPAIGPNTYARIINVLFSTIPISQSVIHRTQTLVEYLTKMSLKLDEQNLHLNALSIGCGPAIEIQRFIREESISTGSRFHLLDFNKETLDYAKKQINIAKTESKRDVSIKTTHESVHKLLKQAARHVDTNNIEQYDLVYCSGLFDYLSDKVCARLLRLFYCWVKPGGMVFATNMHTSNKYRYAMEHIAEWHLIYRDKEQMANFVPNLGKQRLFTDKTGVNLCIEINKPK